LQGDFESATFEETADRGAATPFPSEETTPPVTKIYFGAIHAARVWLRSFQPPSLFALRRSDVHAIMVGTQGGVKSKLLMPRK
jgi:hypothetical protein